jgi:perosamine synthetase
MRNFQMAEKLAICGGKPAVPKSITFKVWPRTTKRDEKFVLDSLRGGKYAWGPNCVKLQEEFARWNGNKFCGATNSGTAALHMGVAACGVSAGDEVITTALSWTSTGTCILHHNAIPIFVDVDWKTMNIAPSKIEAAITPRTRAIIPVHYWGLPADMDLIMRIARKHKLFVIEDACQAHGALYKGRKVGTFGHCAAFSLNQNKNFCAGEGGLFVTDDEKIYVAARALMSFGEMRAPESNRDFHAYGMGWMYRMSDLTAAFARSQLLSLDRTNAQARENWFRLQEGLKGLPNAVLPFSSRTMDTNGYAYVVRVDPSIVERSKLSDLRNSIVKALQAEGVPVGSPRYMLPAHTVFQARNGYGHGCPWTCPFARKDISYSLDQYPEAMKCVDSVIQIAINGHRPPNGKREIDAIIRGVRKVFENLDQVPRT